MTTLRRPSTPTPEHVPDQGTAPEQEHSGRTSMDPPAEQTRPENPETDSANAIPHPGPWSEEARPMRPDEERNWAVMAHISVFLGYLVGVPVLGPFVVLLLVRDRSAFAHRHAATALNYQLSLLLYFLVGALISLLTRGLALWVLVPVAFALLIATVVFIVQGAFMASAGREYRYPLSIRMVR